MGGRGTELESERQGDRQRLRGERSEVSIGQIRTEGDKGRETSGEEKMRATERDRENPTERERQKIKRHRESDRLGERGRESGKETLKPEEEERAKKGS